MSAADPDIEVVDGLPVLATGTADVERPQPPRLSAVPKRQVLALAAGSFFCGAATILLSSKHRQVKVAPRRRRAALPDIIGSDRYLLDVHKLR